MKTVGGILGISSLLITLVAAAPLDKRVLVWHTVTHQVIKTVDVTTTITVGATGKGNTQQALPTTTSTPSSAEPAQFNEASKPTSASSPESTSSYSFPQSTSTEEAAPSVQFKAPEPTTSSTSTEAPYVPPPPPTTSSSPPPPPPPAPIPSSTTSSVAPPPPPPPSALPAASSSTQSTGGECSPGKPCEGDITYFATEGILACGNSGVDGNSEPVVALPHGFMGPASNNNPYCGKKVTVTRGGKSVTATVMDKCMGCTGHSIDLSPAAFKELAALDEGRVEGEWTIE